jgi:hypothetical protein
LFCLNNMKKPQSTVAEGAVLLEYLTNSEPPETLLLTSATPDQYELVSGTESKPLTLLEAFAWYSEHDDPNREDCFSVGTPDLRAAQALFHRVAEFARKGGAR